MITYPLSASELFNPSFMFTPTNLLLALAVWILAMGIPALVNPKGFMKAMKPIMTNTEYLRIIAPFVLLVSFLFLTVHWQFNTGWDWMLIFPLFGWIGVLKGLIFLWFPKFVGKNMKMFFGSKEMMTFWGFLITAIGLLFAYVALYLI